MVGWACKLYSVSEKYSFKSKIVRGRWSDDRRRPYHELRGLRDFQAVVSPNACNYPSFMSESSHSFRISISICSTISFRQLFC